MSKDLKRLIRLAEMHGWSVTLRRGGHLKWQNPDGRMVFSASTCSDYRGQKNLLRDLRHNGLPV